jgi:hypothetical protein
MLDLVIILENANAEAVLELPYLGVLTNAPAQVVRLAVMDVGIHAHDHRLSVDLTLGLLVAVGRSDD